MYRYYGKDIGPWGKRGIFPWWIKSWGRGHMSPLDIPLMKFEIVGFCPRWKSSHGGQKDTRGIFPWWIKSGGKGHMSPLDIPLMKFEIVGFCPRWKKLSWGADAKTSRLSYNKIFYLPFLGYTPQTEIKVKILILRLEQKRFWTKGTLRIIRS